MDRRLQLDGVNNFLSETYSPLTDLPALLGAIGFAREQVASLCGDHLGALLDEFVGLVRTRLVMVRADGVRLFRIISRRFAFDGEPTAILEELGDEFGVSKERIRQLQQKALRSCGGKSHRQFIEDGLQRYAERLVGPPKRTSGAVEHTHLAARPQRGPLPVPAAPPAILPREPGAADPDDIEFIAALLAVLLEYFPDGLGQSMLTHILAGSSGPVVGAVVHHYGLPQYAMLERLGFARVKELVRIACNSDARFVRANGRITLAARMLPHSASVADTRLPPRGETAPPPYLIAAGE